jgi:hypothetical protein
MKRLYSRTSIFQVLNSQKLLESGTEITHTLSEGFRTITRGIGMSGCPVSDLPGEEECKLRHAVSYIFRVGRFSPVLLLCLFLLTAMSAAAGVIIGLPPDSGVGNAFPFGGSYDGEYQQVYNRGQFSGPITITDLEFYNTQVNWSTEINSGTWTISLSSTSADWDTLSPVFASNIGPNNTLVFTGDLSQSWAFGDTLQIPLSTPFTYDPLYGNLLMDVVASGTFTALNVFFDTNGFNGGDLNGNEYLGRVFMQSGVPPVPTVNSGYGLVTGFNSGTSVPEPSSVALFGLGVAVFGLARRRLSR